MTADFVVFMVGSVFVVGWCGTFVFRTFIGIGVLICVVGTVAIGSSAVDIAAVVVVAAVVAAVVIVAAVAAAVVISDSESRISSAAAIDYSDNNVVATGFEGYIVSSENVVGKGKVSNAAAIDCESYVVEVRHERSISCDIHCIGGSYIRVLHWANHRNSRRAYSGFVDNNRLVCGCAVVVGSGNFEGIIALVEGNAASAEVGAAEVEVIHVAAIYAERNI